MRMCLPLPLKMIVNYQVFNFSFSLIHINGFQENCYSFNPSTVAEPISIFNKMSFLFNCCRSGQGEGQCYEVATNVDGKRKIEYMNDVKKVRSMNNVDRVIRVEKSEYEQLVKKNKKDNKWTDTSFPPGPESLGTIENVPPDCEWKRISEILNAPELFDGKIEPKDVIQGSLGDCYFLSAISALAEEEGRIANVFGDQNYNPNGIYKVTLRIDGKIKQVVIDDFVPVNKAGKPLFCQPNKNEFWVIILEKAWAKCHGSYANIASGTPTQVLKAITYAPCELKAIKNAQDHPEHNERLWNEIQDHATRNNPTCAGTKVDPDVDWADLGLVEGHAYTLLDAVTVIDSNETPRKILKIRNPWGQNEWKGEGSENDEEFWSNIVENEAKTRILEANKNGNDGVFFMTYEDFCQYFNQVHLCHLVDNPKYEVEPMHSDKKHGSLYTFTVQQADEYMIELHQDDIRGQNQEKMEAGLNRSTLLLAKGDDYEFIDGSLKYQDEDNTLRAVLDPGKYFVFAKIDPTLQKNLMPDNMSISCYSRHMVNIEPTDRSKHEEFFKKVFLTYARNHKRKQFSEGKMWVSWKLFFEKGGYAFLAFGVEAGLNRKFVITLDEQDFIDSNYLLKKPYKGKGKQTIEIKPGEEEVIVARVKNSQLQPMKFPPPLDIQIEKA